MYGGEYPYDDGGGEGNSGDAMSGADGEDGVDLIHSDFVWSCASYGTTNKLKTAAPVTALAFDPAEEVIWAGTNEVLIHRLVILLW